MTGYRKHFTSRIWRRLWIRPNCPKSSTSQNFLLPLRIRSPTAHDKNWARLQKHDLWEKLAWMLWCLAQNPNGIFLPHRKFMSGWEGAEFLIIAVGRILGFIYIATRWNLCLWAGMKKWAGYLHFKFIRNSCRDAWWQLKVTRSPQRVSSNRWMKCVS